MTSRSAPPIVVLAVVAMLLSACTGDDSAVVADLAPARPAAAPEPAAEPAAARPEPGTTVTISRSRFDLASLVVSAGTTVVFVNEDPFAHTVTSSDGAPVPFDSGDLGEGSSFAVTFDEPGTYAYFCRIHPTMRAAVVVE